jgi:hypothetical protein
MHVTDNVFFLFQLDVVSSPLASIQQEILHQNIAMQEIPLVSILVLHKWCPSWGLHIIIQELDL